MYSCTVTSTDVNSPESAESFSCGNEEFNIDMAVVGVGDFVSTLVLVLLSVAVSHPSGPRVINLEVERIARPRTAKKQFGHQQKRKEKAYITEGSRVVSYLNTNSARWCLTSLFEMGRGGSTIV